MVARTSFGPLTAFYKFGCLTCKKVPVEMKRLVPTEVEKKACGVVGHGGAVHDGRGASMKEYHVAILNNRKQI